MDVETDVFSWRWARDYKDYKLQKINGERKGRREGKGRKEGQEGREKEREWTHKVIL